MKTYTLGDVILTEFPYVSGAAGKKRPALVLLDTGDDDVIIALITSQRWTGAYDVKITDWKQANLQYPSVVRVHKIYTRWKDKIEGKLGNLTANDVTHVRAATEKLWKSL